MMLNPSIMNDVKRVLERKLLLLGKEALGIAWVQIKRPKKSEFHKAFGDGSYKALLNTPWRAFAMRMLQNNVIKTFCNPYIEGIQDNTKRVVHIEQCLSVKGNYKVERYEEITLGWAETTQKKGILNFPEMHLTGRDAMVAQHEMDHLDGILISDRGKKVK